MLRELLTEIVKRGISPNQLYVLISIQDSIAPVHINQDLEIRHLKNSGYLTNDSKLTEKAESLLRVLTLFSTNKKSMQTRRLLGSESEQHISAYRLLWPAVVLPSKKLARASVKELTKNFEWLFKEYPDTTWPEIMTATQNYLDSYPPPYMYMQNSYYFIKKEDRAGNGIHSTLASMIVQMRESADETKPQAPIDKTTNVIRL